MKAFQAKQQQIRRERVEAAIEGRIAALFRRLPMLYGFARRLTCNPMRFQFTPGLDISWASISIARSDYAR